MALQQDVAVVVEVREPGLLVLGFLNIVLRAVRLGQLDVAVKATGHQFLDVVAALAHDVGHALTGVQVRGTVGQHHVFGRDEHAHRAAEVGVVVHLLERRAGRREAPQHALMLGPIFRHLLGQAEVHVLLHPHC